MTFIRKRRNTGTTKYSGVLNLRSKAEAQAEKNSNLSSTNSITVESNNKLLHELQVHQIELEMQNEELRESQIALEIVRSRYFDLYDMAPVGYLTLNRHSLIQQANLTVATMLGTNRQSLIKIPFSKLIFKEDQDIYNHNHIKLIGSNEPQLFDLRILKNDHSFFWANVVFTVANFDNDENANLIELRVVLTDISERKKTEQALHEAGLIAEKANLAKSEFLSNMSHELRTPLNAILGFTQLIESGAPEPTSTQKRNIDQILKAGWYLLELINEILDLAVIESGKVTLYTETLSLTEIMNDAEALLDHQAQKREINMIFPHSDKKYFVKADRIRAKQVFVNLLSNAIKYNKPKGSILVSYMVKSSNRIRVCFEDTGEGLSSESINQLFQPFNRLGKESSGEEGTGIGLMVSKRMIELMGGTIGVESVLGQGSVFWVEMILCDPPS